MEKCNEETWEKIKLLRNMKRINHKSHRNTSCIFLGIVLMLVSYNYEDPFIKLDSQLCPHLLSIALTALISNYNTEYFVFLFSLK